MCYNIALLSGIFKTMLYGGFIESSKEKINFTQNEFLVEALKTTEIFSRTKMLDGLDPNVILELLSFTNRFCCDEMKSACDSYLSSLVCKM